MPSPHRIPIQQGNKILLKKALAGAQGASVHQPYTPQDSDSSAIPNPATPISSHNSPNLNLYHAQPSLILPQYNASLARAISPMPITTSSSGTTSSTLSSGSLPSSSIYPTPHRQQPGLQSGTMPASSSLGPVNHWTPQFQSGLGPNQQPMFERRYDHSLNLAPGSLPLPVHRISNSRSGLSSFPHPSPSQTPSGTPTQQQQRWQVDQPQPPIQRASLSQKEAQQDIPRISLASPSVRIPVRSPSDHNTPRRIQNHSPSCQLHQTQTQAGPRCSSEIVLPTPAQYHAMIQANQSFQQQQHEVPRITPSVASHHAGSSPRVAQHNPTLILQQQPMIRTGQFRSSPQGQQQQPPRNDSHSQATSYLYPAQSSSKTLGALHPPTQGQLAAIGRKRKANDEGEREVLLVSSPEARHTESVTPLRQQNTSAGDGDNSGSAIFVPSRSNSPTDCSVDIEKANLPAVQPSHALAYPSPPITIASISSSSPPTSSPSSPTSGSDTASFSRSPKNLRTNSSVLPPRPQLPSPVSSSKRRRVGDYADAPQYYTKSPSVDEMMAAVNTGTRKPVPVRRVGVDLQRILANFVTDPLVLEVENKCRTVLEPRIGRRGALAFNGFGQFGRTNAPSPSPVTDLIPLWTPTWLGGKKVFDSSAEPECSPTLLSRWDLRENDNQYLPPPDTRQRMVEWGEFFIDDDYREPKDRTEEAIDMNLPYAHIVIDGMLVRVPLR